MALSMTACSREPADGNMAAAVVQEQAPPADANAAPMPEPTASATPGAEASGTPEAVLQRFLTRATKGDRAAMEDWDGTDADARVALTALKAQAGAAIAIGTRFDPDAGAGQRYITVPFTLNGAKGSAVLHKAADGIPADDPRVHDWRLRSIKLPPAPDAAALPATAEATYDCTPGGPMLMVRFDNRADTATVMLDGRTIRLEGQRPASGIWYAGDGYELRGKGRQARFAMPDGGARDCLAR